MATLRAVLSAHHGLGYLAIHAGQFGAQPLLSRRFVVPGTPAASLVLGAEVAKVIGCMGMLKVEGRMEEALKDWSFTGFLWAAGVPSLTYLVQNLCLQVAYQRLDGIVFNILNQTKMLFTAFFVFLIVGRRQSVVQCLALLILTAAGMLVSYSEASKMAESRSSADGFIVGSFCILLGSALSGLGGAIAEWILQRKRRDSYLFSSEMAVLGSVILLVRHAVDPTGEGLFHRWTLLTFVPVLTQGWGGIVVGLIAKTSGSVRKGFAVMVGLILSCVLKWLVEGESLGWATLVAVPLVAASIYLHARYPPAAKQA
ncbi:unnamed protein product [Effrenium voratum]|uniref:Uncharacterized protein n=1 Tax=Effrenium voratum TaxID=2562239 RepID=A0AA36IFK5_9DINO|nr:unnamed protein product [Effrenium voratum]